MSNTEKHSGLVTGLMLAFAVAAAAGTTGLGGCTSALADGNEKGSPRYTDMLIAKSVLEGTFNGATLRDSTVAGGVKELTRVDSPGPVAPAPDGAVVPAETGGAVVPAGGAVVPAATPSTNPSPYIASTRPNDIGLASSSLNQAEPVYDLSLQDAIARTLKNALSIRVEAYNPAIRESQIIQAEAAFDPVVFAQTQWQTTDDPVLIPGTGANGQTLTSQVGIKQLLPTGTTAQLSWGDTYRYFTPGASNTTPSFRTSYADNLNMTITQPLLRGFGTDVTEANIYLAKKDRQISLSTFKRQVITTVADVEAAYMNLVLARTSVDIQERLLNATEDTNRRVQERLNIDADKVSLSQSQAAVEVRRAELIRARVNLRNQSDTLKALINDPEISIRENMLVNPTDRPMAEPIYVSTADSIEMALHQRTELKEARLQVEKANILVKVAKNELLPKLDLTFGVQTNSLERNFDSAFASTVAPGEFLDFNAGIRLEFAIGNRLGESTQTQRKLEQNQALTQVVRIAQTIVQDVKQQLRDMLSSFLEIRAREAARIRAAEELEAITQKENIVALTPEFLQLKLDSQSRLATAEQNLIQSLVNYNIAIMRFEQAKGTLLEFNRISLDRAPVARYADDNSRIRFMGHTYTTDTKSK